MARATLEQLRQHGIDSQAMRDIPDTDKLVALDAAQARIDSYLRMQVTLPLTAPYPMDLIEAECVLAAWTALQAAGYASQIASDVAFMKRLEYWEAYITELGRGEIQPIDDTGVGELDPSGANVITASQRGWSRRGVIGKGRVPFTSD